MQNLIKTTTTGIMKFSTIDLYSSTSVAKELGTTHQKVIQAITKARNYLKSHSPKQFSENGYFNPIFMDTSYINERGREYKSINMNLDAAKVLVKIIDTQKAFDLYVMLMSEFNKMLDEREIRQQSKDYQLGYTDSLQALHIRRVAEGTKQPENQFYSTVARKIHRKATGRAMPKGGIDHCILSEVEETKVLWLKAHIKQWLYYLKDTPAKESKEIMYRLIQDTSMVVNR